MTPERRDDSAPKEGTAGSGQGRRLVSIDALRAVAALSVLFVHIPGFAYGGWRENPWLIPTLLMQYGYLGVPLFIILSGFCIHLRIAQHAGQIDAGSVDWQRFWLRRFIRLYPPYVAAIVFSLSLAHGIHHRYLAEGASGAEDLFWHILLLHNLSDRFSLTLGNGAFWSLGAEEQLYLMYMMIAGFFLRKQWKMLLGAGIIMTAGVRLADTFFPEFQTGPDFFPLALGATPFMYWMHWIMGAVAVEAAVGRISLPRWCSHSAAAFFFLSSGFLSNPLLFRFAAGFQFLRAAGITAAVEQLAVKYAWMSGASRHISELMSAIGFFVVVNWCVRAEQGGKFRSRTAHLFARIGGMSYSLYLVHVPVICSCEVLMPFDWTVKDWFLRMSLYSCISLVAAYVFFCLVEKPCLKLLARI